MVAMVNIPLRLELTLPLGVDASCNPGQFTPMVLPGVTSCEKPSEQVVAIPIKQAIADMQMSGGSKGGHLSWEHLQKGCRNEASHENLIFPCSF